MSSKHGHVSNIKKKKSPSLQLRVMTFPATLSIYGKLSSSLKKINPPNRREQTLGTQMKIANLEWTLPASSSIMGMGGAGGL